MTPTSPRPEARPWVFMNMAMTADGKTATANRAVASFGSPRDQSLLYALRARADAILCGARTVEADGVLLDPGPARFRRWRRRHGLAEFPLRVVATGCGSLSPQAALFRDRNAPLLILATAQASPGHLEALRAGADAVRVCGGASLDFVEALRWLRQDWGVRRLLCEGGGTLNDALWRAGLVDEVHVTVCPWIFGGRAAPTLADGAGFPALATAAGLRLRSWQRRGPELFLSYARA